MSHKYPCIYYDNGKCQKFSDDHYTAWCDFEQCEHITPSNGDRIRGMTDEGLAGFWTAPFCDRRTTRECKVVFGGDCSACVLDWLKQPYKEDT